MEDRTPLRQEIPLKPSIDLTRWWKADNSEGGVSYFALMSIRLVIWVIWVIRVILLRERREVSAGAEDAGELLDSAGGFIFASTSGTKDVVL